MDFGTVLKNECVNVPLPPDERCLDAAFAFANPGLCPAVPKLILKPGSAIVCLLGSIQFRAFYVANGFETDVTDQTLFTVSDPSICVIGVSSGNATGITGIEGGEVIVTGTYKDLTATADLTVLGTARVCCDDETVAFMVMVDTSKSMSQTFGGIYPTKFSFAKKAAQQFISEINATKDVVGLMTFDSFDAPIIDVPTSNKTMVAAHAGTIAQGTQSTTFFDPIQAAITALDAVVADKKVLVIISDGQDQTISDYTTDNPISLAETFKQSGGSVICLGIRSTGTGFTLLNALGTSGFFANSYPGVEDDALAILSGIKGYVCGGNCVPEGDEFVATGQLNYTAWTNWNGQADLLGNGFVDLLPGNGLYVDLSSASAPFNASLTSNTSFPVVAGKNYRLTMNLAGNQRVDLPSNVTVIVRSASVTYINQTFSISDYTSGFAQHAFTFTPQVDDDVTITIAGAGSSTLAVAGPLIDSIIFDNATDLVNLLTDDFSNENVQYVPPRCGTGSTPIYTGESGGGTGGIFTFITGSTTADPSSAVGGIAGSTGAKLIILHVSAASGPLSVSDSESNSWTALTAHSAPTTAHVSQIFYCLLPATTGGPHTFTANGTDVQLMVALFDCPGTPSFIAESGAGSDSFETLQPGNITPSDSVLFFVGLSFSGGGIAIDSDFSEAAGYIAGATSVGDFSIKNSATAENPTWTAPPGSEGVTSMATFGTNVQAGYGFATGYACYGTGCLNSEPPPAQLQDPNPLPDIEAGFTPPQQFKSTKTACVTCPTGFVNVSVAAMVTGDSVTSTVTASSASTPALPTINGAWETNQVLPQWMRWQFTSPQIVTFYSIQNAVGDLLSDAPFKSPSPADWEFQGSNDGVTWTTLDSQSGISWPTTQVTKDFLVSNSTAFTYYRINITAADGPAFPFGGSIGNVYLQIAAMSLIGESSQQECASADFISTASQADADSKAIAAATLLANEKLNCQKLYTSTQTFTAHCPAGTLGSNVTKSKSATSLVSQDDADAKALALAQAEANAALVCDGDNHNQAIAIPDAAPAVPYPSVKRVTGLTGHITKVTVTVKNFSHESPSDVQMVLQSPEGTYVQLMLGCGGPPGANPVTNLTFVFDDAGSAMPQSSVLTSGTFAPTQFGPSPNLPAPAALPPYQTTLAALIGELPNGSFALWIVDKQPIGAGSIAGVPAFDVTITTA